MTGDVTQAALYPCPWCGTAEHLSYQWPGSMTADMPDCRCRVVCTHIDHDTVVGPTAYGKFAAITAWNTRLAAQSGEGRSFEEMKAEEARIMQDWRWGNLTRLGVANHLRRAGFDIQYATDKANALEGEGRTGAGEDGLAGELLETASNLVSIFDYSDKSHVVEMLRKAAAALNSREPARGSEALTLEERWAITQLGRAWDAFLALPVMHPDDQREFRTLIHHAQEKVLARVAMRQLVAGAADE